MKIFLRKLFGIKEKGPHEHVFALTSYTITAPTNDGGHTKIRLMRCESEGCGAVRELCNNRELLTPEDRQWFETELQKRGLQLITI